MKCIIKGHAPNATYHIDGQEVTKAEFDAVCPDKPLGGCAGLLGNQRKLSDALACHPDQVVEYMEDAKKRGVPTEFSADGRPIFESRLQQKNYLRAYGYINRDGSYGD